MTAAFVDSSVLVYLIDEPSGYAERVETLIRAGGRF